MTAITEPLQLDLYTDAVRANPFPLLKELREAAPVHWVSQRGLESWIVTRYDEVRFVLSDPRFVKQPATVPEALRRFKAALGTHEDNEVRSLAAMDPPDHTRLRRLVSKAFTPRRMEALRQRAEAVTEELLDGLERRSRGGASEVDLVEGLTTLLPITMISELVGVPGRDRTEFKEWSDALMLVAHDQAGHRRRRAGAEALRAYFADLVAQRRRTMRPELAPDAQPDLIGALLIASDEDSRLSEQELLSMLILVLSAGYETTGNLIANSVLALLDWPEERIRLQTDPRRLRTAVEELLRFVGTIMQPTLRVADEDVDVGGVTVPAGSVVLCMLASANRDPRRFPAPDDLDLGREDNPHLGFGHGIHFCLGAPLARMETEVALARLLQRFPDVELAVGREDVLWRPSALIRGPAALPVHLRPGSGQGRIRL